MPYPSWSAGQTVTAADLTAMQWVVVEQGEDQTVNNSTTVVDTNLSMQAEAGARYLYRLRVTYTSGSTVDIKFRWTVPSSGSVDRFIQAGGTSSTGSSENLETMVSRRASESTEVPAAGATSSPNTLVYIEDGVIGGGNGGAVTLQFAQNSAVAANTVVQDLSFLAYLRIA